MNLTEIFKATNKNLLLVKNEINMWAEENNFKILQITTANGASYTSKNSSYVLEVEIFLIVLYVKND